jgi:hypothetical protein
MVSCKVSVDRADLGMRHLLVSLGTLSLSPGSASSAESRLQIRLRTGVLTCDYCTSPVLLVAAAPLTRDAASRLAKRPRGQCREGRRGSDDLSE